MEVTKTEAKSFNAPEVKLHFLDYWRIIRIRKTVIIAVFLLVVTTTTLVTFILPESFASTVRIDVEKDATDVAGIGNQSFYQQYDPYWIETQFQTIQSKSILHQVIENLKLNKLWAEKLKEEGELPTDVTYGLLKRVVDVRQSRNTSLIEIKVYSEDKNEAPKIANKIAEVYRDYRLALRREQSSRGIRTLEAELQKKIEAVTNQQALVDKLKIELGISDTDGQNAAMVGTPEPEILHKLSNMRIEAQADFKKFDALYQNFTNLSRVEFKKAVTIASPDPQLAFLQEYLARAEQRMAELAEGFGPDHPEVKGQRRLLEVIRQQVEDRLDGILTGLKARRDSSEAVFKDLLAEEEKYHTFDVKTAVERRPYVQAKRDLENMQLIRDRLNLRVIQEKIDEELPRGGIVTVVDQAEVSHKPVRPNKLLNISLGIIVGLAVGVGLAFFIEYLDTSVKTIDDVERALQAPVLGVIPQNVCSLMAEGPDSPHAEAYRVLRTNILFSQKDPLLNTITIVSGGAGEGKSTTTFNLATVFAQNGQRVLIVDSDLRRPSIHKVLKVSNSIGLTNYLLKQNTLEEVIQTTPLATLDFMPSGKLPSSSMGVLSSMQMKELINDLKRRYDWVFFDSPPIMGVSDASILASEVDLVLQVIQYRRYPQPMTIRAKQMIEKVGGNLLGVVLNNISMAADENYYYYSGYYYDYYSKQEEEPADKDGEASKSNATGPKVEIKPKY